jgi:hypothetical protein
MRIPNHDGEYQTKDGKIVVVVTRKYVQIEMQRPQNVHIIDEDDTQPTQNKPSGLRNARKVIDDINNLLW